MARPVRIALGLLLAAAACTPPPAEPLPGVDVRHYDVALRLDPASGALSGRARLDVRLLDTLSVLPLAFGTLTLDTVLVDGVPVAADRGRGGVRIPLPPGRDSVRVTLVYHGTPARGVRRAWHRGRPVLVSEGWPDAARGWLPGRYHPSDPATFTLALTLPPGQPAVASGTPAGCDALPEAVRCRWRLDSPAPPYTFAFAVGGFTEHTAPADAVPLRYLMLDDGAEAQLRRTPKAMAFLTALLGPYPYGTYTAVQVPLAFAGMENAATAFIQAELFEAGEAEAVQVHELAHQWFGNRVPPASWEDLWLSEGMATYLTALFYAHVDGPEAGRRRLVDLARWTAARRRTHGPLVPTRLRQPEDHLNWVPYEKGAAVLHLLRLRLGDAAFFDALRTAYRRGTPLSTEDFRRLLEAAGGDDLEAFFRYWVYGEALPSLRTTWEVATRTLRWHLDDDAGTLRGLPFELVVHQGRRARTVEASAGAVRLDGWGAEAPEVRAVGVLLRTP